MDVVRGIGILLVVLGHMAFPKPLINLIYLFHMPLFFYVSGSFFKGGSVKQESKLWVTYFVYGLFFCGLASVLFHEGLSENLFYLFSIRPLTLWNIPYFGLMWFVLTLISVRLIAMACNGLQWPESIRLIVAGVLFLGMAWAVTQWRNLANLPMSPVQASLMLFFFELGRQKRLDRFLGNRAVWICTLVFGAVLSVELLWFNAAHQKIINYHHGEVFNSILGLVGAVAGIYLVLRIATSIPSKSWISTLFVFLGRRSFTIFIWHLFVFMVTGRIFGKVVPLDAPYMKMAIQLLALGVFLFAYDRLIVSKLPSWITRWIYV